MVEINFIIGLVVLVVFLLFLKSLPSKLPNERIPRAAVKQKIIIDTQTPDHNYIPCDICNNPAVGHFSLDQGYTFRTTGNSPRH